MVDGSAIDRVVAHFAGLTETPIDIPEWGIKATVRPMTVADKSYIMDKAAGDEFRLMVFLLIRKLKSDGAPVFLETDRLKLENSGDERVIRRVAMELMAAEPEVGN